MALELTSQEIVRWAIAAVLIILAWPLSNKVVRLLQAAALAKVGSKGGGVTTAKFLAECLRFVILIGAGLIALSLLGVNSTSIAAVLGAATLAIGLALQGTLANVAAGVLIIVLRLYRVGDVIETLGHIGTVRLVSLFTTELETFAGRQVLLPNGEVLKQPIVNINRYPKRRIDVNLTLAWQTDPKVAGDAAIEALKSLEGALTEPAPTSIISAFDPRGPMLSVRIWVASEHANQATLTAPALVHQALRAGGHAVSIEAATLASQN